MQNFRILFFQILLVILALAFLLCIYYLESTETAQAGTFGAAENNNITITDLFTAHSAERRQE